MIFLRLIFIIYLTDATYLYFDRNSYEVYVSEAAPIYSKIALLKAISSPLLTVQYELHGDTDKTFYLNSLTGELMLLNMVDYETKPLYKLTIEARSLFTVAPCFTELIVHILNINDNSPDINLVIYPSVLYESTIIKYDLHTYSTPFATISIKDFDESTKNLSLDLNDTEHFYIQLIRQWKNDVIYILSTKNNPALIHQDYYHLQITSCDNDQPVLCTNKSFKFHMKSSEYLCNLSFHQKTYILDVKENLPEKTHLMHKITNKFCQNITYSIDDAKNFYIDSYAGDLFTLKKFNRTEQSIYMINMFVNNYAKINIIVRILDQYGNIPFLINKYLIINPKNFFFVHLFNSSFCRSQIMFESYFELLSNCTIIPLTRPPLGQYLFKIELEQRNNYQDTFLLELSDIPEHASAIRHSKSVIIIPIILSVLFAIGLISGIIIIFIKQKQYKNTQLCCSRQNATSSSLSSSSTSFTNNIEDEKSRSKIASKLKVYDDHELSSSPTNTATYLVQKPSPPRASLSPARDDEGYSGSSNVSENHSPLETTIISAYQLFEQYHIHEYPNRLVKSSSSYDTPRRPNNKRDISCKSPNVSLV